jgi:hypothetical protein
MAMSTAHIAHQTIGIIPYTDSPELIDTLATAFARLPGASAGGMA